MGQIKQDTEKVWLKAKTDKDEKLEACFLPSKGMNFISYKKDDLEVIDQSTKELFEERFAGLGAMIGPHFHHRSENRIPQVPDESFFPHIAILKSRGIKEPFSHGIGRYAPWTVLQQSEDKIKAQLKGEDTWHGVPLKDLEGQDFTMDYEAQMVKEGLKITLTCTSENACVVGLHTYYALEKNEGRVCAQIQPFCNEGGNIREIDSTWNLKNGHEFIFALDKAVDLGFFPFPDPKSGLIVLETGNREIKIFYWAPDENHSWQLWHKGGGSFVCIEPLSAKNPRVPTSNKTQIQILISI